MKEPTPVDFYTTGWTPPEGAGHPAAIAADRANPFHHRSAFIRFRPLESTGHLERRNPLPSDALR